MKIKDIVVLEKTSKKGNTYKALFAITDTNEEIFITFVK